MKILYVHLYQLTVVYHTACTCTVAEDGVNTIALLDVVKASITDLPQFDQTTTTCIALDYTCLLPTRVLEKLYTLSSDNAHY